jgi:molybdopterin-guanine dinucleotide biosynthesis protein A
MGSDKSLIHSNVERLADELRKSGCSRVIVMCGTPQRSELFDEECIPDSADNLSDSLLTLLSQLNGSVQLAPCDAYLADEELFSRIDGVPVDDNGKRQPLLAKFDSSMKFEQAPRIRDLFQLIPSCEGGIKARNVNTPEELMEIQSYLQTEDR